MNLIYYTTKISTWRDSTWRRGATSLSGIATCELKWRRCHPLSRKVRDMLRSITTLNLESRLPRRTAANFINRNERNFINATFRFWLSKSADVISNVRFVFKFRIKSFCFQRELKFSRKIKIVCQIAKIFLNQIFDSTVLRKSMSRLFAHPHEEIGTAIRKMRDSENILNKEIGIQLIWRPPIITDR